MDRAQMIYAILGMKHGNYRTAAGAKTMQVLAKQTNEEIQALYNKYKAKEDETINSMKSLKQGDIVYHTDKKGIKRKYTISGPVAKKKTWVCFEVGEHWSKVKELPDSELIIE